MTVIAIRELNNDLRDRSQVQAGVAAEICADCYVELGLRVPATEFADDRGISRGWCADHWLRLAS